MYNTVLHDGRHRICMSNWTLFATKVREWDGRRRDPSGSVISFVGENLQSCGLTHFSMYYVRRGSDEQFLRPLGRFTPARTVSTVHDRNTTDVLLSQHGSSLLVCL